MPNDVRDLPAGGQSDGLYRFLGGSPLSVAFRLILLSILVGVVLAAIGFDQAVGQPEQRRLAGARAADDREEFTLGHIERDVVDRHHATIVKTLADMRVGNQRRCGHSWTILGRPHVSPS